MHFPLLTKSTFLFSILRTCSSSSSTQDHLQACDRSWHARLLDLAITLSATFSATALFLNPLCIDNLQQARPNFPLFLQVKKSPNLHLLADSSFKSHDGVDVMGNSHESRHCGQQHLLCHLRWQPPKFDPRRTWWPHVLPEDDDPVEENPVEDTSGSVNDSGEEKCAVLERRAAVVSLRRFH